MLVRLFRFFWIFAICANRSTVEIEDAVAEGCGEDSAVAGCRDRSVTTNRGVPSEESIGVLSPVCLRYAEPKPPLRDYLEQGTPGRGCWRLKTPRSAV